MRTILTTVLLAVLAAPAMAQSSSHENSTHQPSAASSVPAMTVGEIRKVDKEARKITIKHGEIKNLDMPAMTMVFQVKDAAMLDKLKVGDKVRFVAAQAPSGLMITEIHPTP